MSRDVRDSFDNLFDYNKDGKLDPIEQGIQDEFLRGEDEREDSFFSCYNIIMALIAEI